MITSMRTLLNLAEMSPSQLADVAGVSRSAAQRFADGDFKQYHYVVLRKIGRALHQQFSAKKLPPLNMTEFYEAVERMRTSAKAAK